jgi:hypothetical protein
MSYADTALPDSRLATHKVRKIRFLRGIQIEFLLISRGDLEPALQVIALEHVSLVLAINAQKGFPCFRRCWMTFRISDAWTFSGRPVASEKGRRVMAINVRFREDF